MKIKKIFAGMSAAAIAMSMMAVSASAETFNGNLNVGAIKPIVIETRGDKAYNMVVIPWEVLLQGVEEGSTLTTIEASFTGPEAAEYYAANGWSGGGGDFGFSYAIKGFKTNDNGEEEQENVWYQSGTSVSAPTDGTPDFTFKADIPATYEEKEVEYEQDLAGTEGDFQFGWWGWGSGGYETITINTLALTFSDGSVVNVVAKDGTIEDVEAYKTAVPKKAREVAASEALDTLVKGVEAATFDDVIDKMNGAAEGLNNAAAVLEEADKAATQVKELEAALADAQAAFDALEEGDEADTETFKAAKAAVESASKDLADAKKALEDAMAAYDEATAAQIVAKNKEIEELTAAKEAAEKELADLKKDADANAAKIAELEKQIADKDAEIAKLKDEKKDLQKQLEEALANAGNGGSGNGGSGSGNGNGGSGNPKTGAAALGLGAIALAGAAVVVSKKKD